MRQKRVKSYRKVMGLYQQAFGFREPYQLLVDAAFVKACVQQKLDVMARLQDVLQGTVKPMITQCCIHALYEAGEEGQAAVDAAKGFERRKCNHFKARPEDECMLTMAGKENRNRYVFATQSQDLRQQLRKVPGSPIIYIARSVMLLEAPSDQTMAKKKQMESAKLHVSAEELAQITGQPIPSTSAAADSADEAAEGVDGADEPPKKKRKQKGPKGPNPLSVKKKKQADPAKGVRPSKRLREEPGEGREEREQKRKREEEAKVVSLSTRSTAEGGEGERKKRKRRRKGGAGGTAEGGTAAEGGDGRVGGGGDDE
ncbi:hypothetical protein JCM11251_005750 [Rhodosporidiobolus azoricus]